MLLMQRILSPLCFSSCSVPSRVRFNADYCELAVCEGGSFNFSYYWICRNDITAECGCDLAQVQAFTPADPVQVLFPLCLTLYCCVCRSSHLIKVFIDLWRQPINSPNRTRTCDILVNSQTLYQLSYRRLIHKVELMGFEPTTFCLQNSCSPIRTTIPYGKHWNRTRYLKVRTVQRTGSTPCRFTFLKMMTPAGFEPCISAVKGLSH